MLYRVSGKYIDPYEEWRVNVVNQLQEELKEAEGLYEKAKSFGKVEQMYKKGYALGLEDGIKEVLEALKE